MILASTVDLYQSCNFGAILKSEITATTENRTLWDICVHTRKHVNLQECFFDGPLLIGVGLFYHQYDFCTVTTICATSVV